MIIDELAIDLLLFTETLESNIKGASAEDLLVFADRTHANILLQVVSGELHLAQLATVVKNNNLSAGNTIIFSQALQPRVSVHEVTDQFFMWQDAVQTDKTPLVSQLLAMNELATGQASRGTYDTLVMTDQATVSGSYSPIVNQVLDMLSTSTAYKPDKNFINGPFTVEGP